jgi:hypothetical protein
MTSKVVSTLIDVDKQFLGPALFNAAPKVGRQIKFQFKKSGIKLSTIGVSASLLMVRDFLGGNVFNIFELALHPHTQIFTDRKISCSF